MATKNDTRNYTAQEQEVLAGMRRMPPRQQEDFATIVRGLASGRITTADLEGVTTPEQMAEVAAALPRVKLRFKCLPDQAAA